MWVLVIASCMAGEIAPECGSAIDPIAHPSQLSCADAAVAYHDHLRRLTDDRDHMVLLLDTTCLRIPVTDLRIPIPEEAGR